MKNKKIIDVCKKAKRINLHYDETTKCQWISDGSAIYPLLNVPRLNFEYICKLYDVTDSQKEKIFFQEYNDIPEELNLEDSIKNETITEILDISIIIDGGILIPIMTEEGLMFIQNKYLSPFSDVPRDDISIYTRKDSVGRTLFAIKIGLLLYGLVYPYDAVNEDFVEKLTVLHNASVVALRNK